MLDTSFSIGTGTARGGRRRTFLRATTSEVAGTIHPSLERDVPCRPRA